MYAETVINEPIIDDIYAAVALGGAGLLRFSELLEYLLPAIAELYSSNINAWLFNTIRRIRWGQRKGRRNHCYQEYEATEQFEKLCRFLISFESREYQMQN